MNGTGNQWSLIVGVNEYEDIYNYGSLQVRVKDAVAIRNQLIASGFKEQRVRMITDETSDLPTRDNIGPPPESDRGRAAQC